MPFADRYGGAAVATRWPHRIVEALDQRGADAPDVPWCTLAASVPVPALGEVLFIGTTFSWRLNAESARERQAVALTDLDARHRGPLPTILAGDFNAEPGAASIRYLSGLQSLGGRSAHYPPTPGRSRATAPDTPGPTRTREHARRSPPSSASPGTGGGSTTSSSGRGTPTPGRAPGSPRPGSPSTSRPTASGPATTSASWSNST